MPLGPSLLQHRRRGPGRERAHWQIPKLQATSSLRACCVQIGRCGVGRERSKLQDMSKSRQAIQHEMSRERPLVEGQCTVPAEGIRKIYESHPSHLDVHKLDSKLSVQAITRAAGTHWFPTTAVWIWASWETLTNGCTSREHGHATYWLSHLGKKSRIHRVSFARAVEGWYWQCNKSLGAR